MKLWLQRGACALLVLAAVSGLWFIWQHRDMPSFGAIQDDGIYMLSARAISQGDSYRLTHLPSQPLQTKYPPLLPAAVAAIWTLAPGFPANLSFVAWIGSIAMLAVLGLAYLLFRAWRFPVAVAAGLCALIAIHPIVVKLSVSVMTEIPFMALLLGSLWLATWSSDKPAKWAFAAGLLGGLAYLTRTAALPLAVTVPLVMFLQSRRRHAAVFFAGIAPALIGWQIWVLTNRQPTTDWVLLYYTDYTGMELASIGWHNIAQVLYINLESLLSGMGNLLVSLISDSFFGHQFGRLLAVAAWLGAFRLCRRTGQWQFFAFAVMNCMMLLVWHFPPNERFTVPLVPLLLAGLWAECENLVGLIRLAWNHKDRSNRVAAAIIAAALALFGVFFLARAMETRYQLLPEIEAHSRQQNAQLTRAFDQVKKLTPLNATILCDWDSLLHLYTDRKAYRTIVPPAMLYEETTTSIQEEFARMPDSAGRRWEYALITDTDWNYALKPEERMSIRKRIAARNDLTVLYEDKFATLYQRNQSTITATNSQPR